MEKFNVVKRWNVNKKPCMAFVSTFRGVTQKQAETILEEARNYESQIIGQDTDSEVDYDNSLYGRFEVNKGGIIFEYKIEEDYAFQMLSKVFCPSNQNFKLN